jgi:hypothetical protein
METIRYRIGSKLEYDEKSGMPRIQLEEIWNMAVRVLSPKEHDKLMQIYECGNWKWMNGTLPTDYPNIVTGSVTNVSAKNYFQETGNPKYFPSINVISLKDFYKSQRITSSQLKEINNWFKENKPDRKSRKRGLLK